ncbi:MAG: hypothetical protein HOP19_14780 [Acidobacteria bacterium]|nr:hypothetical protein [Acidobacteriota bacterium]
MSIFHETAAMLATTRRRLSAHAFAAHLLAERASFCVARVIAGSGIAAPPVARKRGRNSYAQPVSAINTATPDASIMGIANVPIAVVWQHGNLLR